jgi:hypothetical protein
MLNHEKSAKNSPVYMYIRTHTYAYICMYIRIRMCIRILLTDFINFFNLIKYLNIR